MTAWWNGLSARERLIVSVGGALAGALVLMQLVVSPLLGWRAAAEQRADTAERAYQLVARAAATASPASGAADLATPARGALTDAASRYNVALTFVNAQGDNSVSFQASAVSPDALFALFSELEARYAIRVVTADIARDADNAASVRVQASLSR